MVNHDHIMLVDCVANYMHPHLKSRQLSIGHTYNSKGKEAPNFRGVKGREEARSEAWFSCWKKKGCTGGRFWHNVRARRLYAGRIGNHRTDGTTTDPNII